MGTKLLATTWRLPCNQASTQNTGSLLTGTGNVLTCWKASTLIIQGALFIGDSTQSANLVTDLSNVEALVLAMRAGGPTGALLFNEIVIPVANLNAGLLFANWTAGTDQHFTITVTAAMLNVAAQQKVWLVVGINAVDGSAFPVATNSGVQINDPGINNPTDTNATSVYTGWSKAEADARYLPIGTPTGSFAPAVTSVGDGAPTSLEALPTVGQTVPLLKTILIAATGELQDWTLATGNDATDATHQQPNDHAQSGFAWTRKR